MISKIASLIVMAYSLTLSTKGAVMVEFNPITPSAQYISITQQYYVDIQLVNNSNNFPLIDHGSVAIDRIRLSGVFSDAGTSFIRSPSFASNPWAVAGMSSYSSIRRVDSVNKRWEMVSGTTSELASIQPGEATTFRIFFNVPAPYSLNDLVYGDIQAEAFTTRDGTIVALEPTTLRGPIGIVPEPSSMIILALGMSILLARRSTYRSQP